MFKKPAQGFTLIELMIVVAVLGILVFVGVNKYVDMIQKSREANVKNNLSALRSALTSYYADNDSEYPYGTLGNNVTTLADTLVPKYIKEIFPCFIYPFHTANATTDNIDKDNVTEDDGEWDYVSASADAAWGKVIVECTHVDSRGLVWTAY